jgi:hypothetical protein
VTIFGGWPTSVGGRLTGVRAYAKPCYCTPHGKNSTSPIKIHPTLQRIRHPASQWRTGLNYVSTNPKTSSSLTKIPADDLEVPLGELRPRTFSGRIPARAEQRLTSLVTGNSERPRTCRQSRWPGTPEFVEI